MPIQHIKNEYAIPRGRVYFDRFDALDQPTGEIPLGNCPGFTFTAATEKAEHYSSETGLREKDAALIVQVNRTGKLTCDNFSAENLALFLSGVRETQTVAAGTVAAEPLTVYAGRHYQLGQGLKTPAGVRNVTDLVVKSESGAVTYQPGVDFEADLELGRLQILPGGAIAAAATPTAGTPITVSYKTTATVWDRVRSGATAEVRGALRVVSDNASGANRDWYMPLVTLTPDGDIPIIAEGTDFVKMEFGVEVLRSANREALYVDGRPLP